MDGRHWWFTTKLQESFDIRSFDNPTVLEEFVAEPKTLQFINDFLSSGGIKFVYFYICKQSQADPKGILNVTDSPLEIPVSIVEDGQCVYFFRHDSKMEVDTTGFEQEIFMGQVKGNPLCLYNTLVSQVFAPILKKQNHWAQAFSSNVSAFLSSFDKQMSALHEFASSSVVHTHVLKKSTKEVTHDFKHSRALIVNNVAVQEYEQLAVDWMETMESMLVDNLEEKVDLTLGPISELHQCRKRLKGLCSITEQLKNKECKAVIGILIAAKSKVLKRWKMIDAGITDSLNDVKDKVKYLEALRKFFEQLHQETKLSTLLSHTLPSMFASIRQMDSASKFYARSGFLGLLFTKVTNQVVVVCKQYICDVVPYVFDKENEPEYQIWKAVEKEVNVGTDKTSKLKSPARLVLEGSSESLLTRLYSCLQLRNQYVDMFHMLQEGLGGVHNLKQAPHVLGGLLANSRKGISIVQSGFWLPGHSSSQSRSVTTPSLASEHVRDASLSVQSTLLTGVAFNDEDVILQHLELFCQRLNQLIDIIESLKQFQLLVQTTKRLPRLAEKQWTNSQGNSVRFDCGESDEEPDGNEYSDGNEDLETADKFGSSNTLHTEVEEKIEADSVEFQKYMTSVSCEIHGRVKEISAVLSRQLKLPSTLDVTSSCKGEFESLYAYFLKSVQSLEHYVIKYVEVAFKMKWSTEAGLDILTSFAPVYLRAELSPIIQARYMDVFSWYEKDLDRVEKLYMTYKDKPPQFRNMPNTASAVHWVRGLYRKIEEPMKIFKDVKFINQMPDYARVVKIFNRVAIVLVRFEEAWLECWRSDIERAKKGLQATLLAWCHVEGKLVLNLDSRILELLANAKWLKLLDIPIPESAGEILRRRENFQAYQQRLSLLLDRYYSICGRVPVALQNIAQPLLEATLHFFQPGRSALTWDALNIDSFVHQVEMALDQLDAVLLKICRIEEEGLLRTMQEISKMIFFDADVLQSTCWEAEKFVTVQDMALRKTKLNLQSALQSMEAALQDILHLLSNQQLGSPCLSPVHASSSQQYASSLLTQSSSQPRSSPWKTAVDGNEVNNVYLHYSRQVCQCVVQTTRTSLAILLNCLDTSASVAGQEESALPLRNEVVIKGARIKFAVDISFSVPTISTNPSLNHVQAMLNTVVDGIIDVGQQVNWWSVEDKHAFREAMASDKDILSLKVRIGNRITDLQGQLDSYLQSFCRLQFLWKDNMRHLYKEFSNSSPSTDAYHEEVERLKRVEADVRSIPSTHVIGALVLNVLPIKDSLIGFAVAWKLWYAQALREMAKANLDQLIREQTGFRERVTSNVASLDQLHDILKLLQQIADMENKIDEMYLPVETLYSKLLSYDIPVPRVEVESVRSLRDRWAELCKSADEVRQELMRHKRPLFEQELDKQVKDFVVEVIQFRNSFDSQGPGVPGINPEEAVLRLKDFQARFSGYDNRRQTLDAVQLLYGVIPTIFPELDATGDELKLLGQLYAIYQNFLTFEHRFQDRLWGEVDLAACESEVQKFWKDCNDLPKEIHGWGAFKDMKDAISSYMQVFPVLQKLAGKEIRNRHWLQVMKVTGTSFQLEAHILKLLHILDAQLIKHCEAIEEIVQNARSELQLEINIRLIEEEWTEQVLAFRNFKSRGLVTLDKSNTNHLLEQLEDAKAKLALMLTSRHIKPLRDEAASWAMKLNEICEVLEQWLTVEELWENLEQVFSQGVTATELPQEFSRFVHADRAYMKMMRKAVDVKNVLQCCIGGDVPKQQTLKNLHGELDVCFKSLSDYLTRKRRAFPRFFFVTDAILLSMLSKSHNLASVLPYIGLVIPPLHDVETVTVDIPDSPSPDSLSSGSKRKNSRRSTMGSVDRRLSLAPVDLYHRERISAVPDGSRGSRRSVSWKPSHLENGMSVAIEEMQGSDDWKLDVPKMYMVSVSDRHGEQLVLRKQVKVEGAVEEWLNTLLTEMHRSLRCEVQKCIDLINGNAPVEDWILRFCEQVAIIGLVYLWTRECECGIADIRLDRKALSNTGRKFSSLINKILQMLSRGSWKTSSPSLQCVQRARLESVVGVGLHLRDNLEDLPLRKVRDCTDFDWLQNLRYYKGSPNARPVGQHEDSSCDLTVSILHDAFSYGYEFLGCCNGVALSPCTERCFLILASALSAAQPCIISGPPTVGKSSLVKSLSHFFGQHLFEVSCTPNMSSEAVSRIFAGCVSGGSWASLNEFNRCSSDVMSLIDHYLTSLYQAVRLHADVCHVPPYEELSLSRSFSVFATAPSSFWQASSPVLRSLFRNVSISFPDVSVILRTLLAAQGFKSIKCLSEKIKMVNDLCSSQIPCQSQMGFGHPSLIRIVKQAGHRRQQLGAQSSVADADVPAMASPAGFVATFSLSGAKGTKEKVAGRPVTSLPDLTRWELGVVSQAVIECILPRLLGSSELIFNSIMQDVFGDVLGTSALPIKSTKAEDIVEEALQGIVNSRKLSAHKPWMTKIMQLYQLSLVHQAIIVSGPSGSGKTSCIANLVEALNEASAKMSGTSPASCSHKLERISMLAVADLRSMFGRCTETGDWVDGVFSALWRKANRQQSVHQAVTWIVLDAPLHDSWCEDIKSVVSDSQSLTLPTLERLRLCSFVKLLIETGPISNAAPSVVSSMGILCLDNSVLGWRPLAEAWLLARPTQNLHTLKRAFEKVMDPICLFMQREARTCAELSETALFRSCLAILTALFKEHTDLGGDLHVERLFLFALIWTFGGVIVDPVDRHGFSSLILSLSTALPDDDNEISVFDYYVDESGEWDTWETRFNEMPVLDPSLHLSGQSFIDTVETSRLRFLMELAYSAGRNILLNGPRSCGKSCVATEFLSGLDNKNTVCKKIAFSRVTDAAFIQEFVENSICHRQGFVYGARNNKSLTLFLDDIHLPQRNALDCQSANELLRQLADQQLMLKLRKPFDRMHIENLIVIATMDSEASIRSGGAYSRLLGNFCVFSVAEPGSKYVRKVTSGFLQSMLASDHVFRLSEAFQQQILEASTTLLSAVQKALTPSSAPGRQHYLFNIGDLAKVFESLAGLVNDVSADEEEGLVLKFWKHEVQRVFADQISQASDLNWFQDTLRSIIKENFTCSTETEDQIFTTFQIDPTFKTAVHDSRKDEVAYRSLPKKQACHRFIVEQSAVHTYLANCLRQYAEQRNEDLGITMHVAMSDLVVRIHRILSFESRANALLISSVPEQVLSCVKLATLMIDFTVFNVDISSQATFFHGLRAAMRSAACEARHTVLIFKDSDLVNEVYLDALNSLLSIAEYGPLFTEPDLNALLQTLLPVIKRKFPNYMSDPKMFFINQLKRNLHVIFCLHPGSSLLGQLKSEYPNILSACHVSWFQDWSHEYLMGEAHAQLCRTAFWVNLNENWRSATLSTLASIHTRILLDCQQLPWANHFDPAHPDVTFPKSFAALLYGMMDQMVPSKLNRQVEPKTFTRFVHCFVSIFENRTAEFQRMKDQRIAALSSLSQTRMKADSMQENLSRVLADFAVAEERTALLLGDLIRKASLIERLKAKLGIGSSSLRAFMELIDMEIDGAGDDISLDDDRDEFDDEYERLQFSASLGVMKTLEERLVDAQSVLERCRDELNLSEKKLYQLQAQIDRGCIERLRAYQQPPPLVGTIMVMVMVLLGRPEFSSYVSPSPSRVEKRADGMSSADEYASRAGSAKSRKPGGSKSLAGVAMDGRVDRSTWKTIQLIMQDSQKFCDFMNSYNWREGLTDDVLTTVVSFFAPGEEISDADRSLPTGHSSSPGSPDRKDRKAQSLQGISLQAAKYASEDAAQMVEFAQSVIAFSRRYRPYQRAVDLLAGLKAEKEELDRETEENRLISEAQSSSQPDEVYLDPTDGLSEHDLPRMEAELSKLQQDFDQAAVVKHDLNEEISKCTERLKAVYELLASLQSLQSEWRSFADGYPNMANLLTNCIVASAFIAYCGPMEKDQRARTIEKFFTICATHGLPKDSRKLFTDVSFIEFLGGKRTTSQYEAMQFPMDDQLLNNLSVVILQHCAGAWPLLCDASRVGEFCLRKLLADFVFVKYHECWHELDRCLQEGRKLLITDVDVNSMHSNSRLMDVIRKRAFFFAGQSTFKTNIGGDEIECSSRFRLIMTASSDACLVPATVACELNVLQFTPSQKALTEVLLSRFMSMEKSRIENTLKQIHQEKLGHENSMLKAEIKLLDLLVGDSNFYDDLNRIKKIAVVKKSYDDAADNYARAEDACKSARKSREAYLPIAIQASVMFKVSLMMRQLDSLYDMSLQQFLCIFDSSVKQSDRTAVSVVADRVTENAFLAMTKTLYEEDRSVFALLAALETEDSQGRISAGDREYLIHPRFGAFIKLGGQDALDCSRMTPKSSLKKPFDWMTDEQHQNLLILYQHYEWFNEAFEKMPKDGRELQWRQIMEHDRPELVSLPDGLDEKYTPIQRFLVLRAVRSDRILQAANVFVTMTLGKRVFADSQLDLSPCLRLIGPSCPLLLLYKEEPEMALRLLLEQAQAKEIALRVVHFSGLAVERQKAEEAVKAAIRSGAWLFFADIHRCVPTLLKIPTLLKDVRPDNTFRLFLSAHTASKLPSHLLPMCLKTMVDTPTMKIQSGVINCLRLVKADAWKATCRPEWPAILHNLSVLQNSLRLRATLNRVGLCEPDCFYFSVDHFLASVEYAVQDVAGVSSYEDQSSSGPPLSNSVPTRPVQWTSLRSCLSKIVYGSQVTNTFDGQALSALIDFWVNASSTRKDFELSKAKYKLPALLFTNGVKSQAVFQALENQAENLFETMEFCGIYDSEETICWADQYVLTRLNLLLDSLPRSCTLLGPGSINESAAACESGPVVVCSGSRQPQGASYAQVFKAGVFASASRAALLGVRETNLSEVATVALNRLPRLWSKDFVSDRIKKSGGLTPYNLWLLAEIDAVGKLHHTIRSSLQLIKDACDGSSLGLICPQSVCDDARDLYNLRVPQRWCQLAGPSCPPSQWPLSAWLQDFQSRFGHIEKVLLQGRERMPAYWLGAFFYPKRLLSVVLQDGVRCAESRTAQSESLLLKTEMTGRDKDHVRDPPAEGMFVYGVSLWGCAWEKTTGEILDGAPKNAPHSLSVIHVQTVARSRRPPAVGELQKATLYECPCFATRFESRDVLFTVDVEQKDVPASRWALRGLACTLRPF